MNRSNPFDEIERTFERTSRQFDEMGRQWEVRGLGSATEAGTGGISLDVAGYDDSVVVTADLPGFDRSDIDLTVDGGGERLTIAAERTNVDESSSDDGRLVRRERRSTSLRRAIPLPAPVMEAEASARYANGVLTVSLPKRSTDDSDAHRIDVE
jgi:HSP20 family protein